MYSRPSPRIKCVAVTRPASIASALSQPPSSDCRPNSPADTLLPRPALPLTLPRWLFRNFTRLGISGIAALLGAQIVSVIDPDFNSDTPLSGLRLREPELDLGPPGGQGQAAGHAGLLPSHFRAAKSAGKLDANPFGAPFHGLVDGPFHGTAKAGPLFQLF